MARGWSFRALGAVVLAAVTGCSLFVEAGDIDEGCPAGRKFCPPLGCVDVNEPAYGCTLDDFDCAPCDLAAAIPRCDGDQCVVAECLVGFDCPNQDGCLNTLVDTSNCGECGRVCAVDEACSNGSCVVRQVTR